MLSNGLRRAEIYDAFPGKGQVEWFLFAFSTVKNSVFLLFDWMSAKAQELSPH